jgi:hypothetical protein
MKYLVLLMAAGTVLSACASAGDPQRIASARDHLRAAMQTSVATREQRDAQSRLLVQEVEAAQLERLTLSEIEAALGHGNSCRVSDLCAAQGFGPDDWYYPIGQVADEKIKQLPTLIIGFDPHGRAMRVFTLRTH